MRHKSEILELKTNELKFSLKKLQIHEKINNQAMLQFSDYFKEFIDTIDNRGVRHRLKQIAGLAGEDEKPMNKTAKRAKQQAQYRRGRNKVKQDFEEQVVEPPPEKPKKPMPKGYKSLYRKIAGKTHPDRIKDDAAKEEIFRKVTNAVDSEDYFKLVEFAVLLDIEIPDEVPIDTKDIDKRIEESRNKIKQITKSVAWEWYHLEEDSDKKKLIEGYASYLLENK
jgi:hypothetical protein